MIVLLPCIILFALSIYFFFREVRLDRKRFIETYRKGNEHVLKEVERFKQKIQEKNLL